MNNGGDAAEQIVRLSLEGFEVAAKLTGTAAKELTVLLVSVLKQEQKTKGKARLTNMLKSGKELKVFSVPQKDLKKFTEQAKKYGVLYCVLRDKFSKDENAPVDIIARAEDASKIQRIFDRFELGKVDKAYRRNENKHYMRAVRSIEPFDYDDDLLMVHHPELIVDTFEEPFCDARYQKVRQALSSLKPLQKQRIIKYFFENKTTYEIAYEEGCTHQAICKSINAALKKLKKIL